jgi:hypothetical protein
VTHFTAKSNIVSQNKDTAADPQKVSMDKMIIRHVQNTTLADVTVIRDVEYFIRNLAALGTCADLSLERIYNGY